MKRLIVICPRCKREMSPLAHGTLPEHSPKNRPYDTCREERES